MRTSLLAVLCLGLLAATGCRSDPRMQLLERELRIQEDALYEMEDLVDEYESKLETCREENASLRKELADSVRPSGPMRSAPTEAPPRRPETDEPKPGDLTPPKIELPPGLDPLSRKRLLEQLEQLPEEPGESGQPALIPADGNEAIGKAVSVKITETDSTRVSEIRLNRLLTGGYNSDGREGDEGITAVVEPRDKDDNLIPVAAPISVVVLDPASDGESARIARWDFPAEEVAKVYRRTPLGEGFCLEMPWPDMPPAHDKLQVFVRYTRSDGRKLETDRPITVALAGRVARDWTSSEPPTEATSRSDPPSTDWRRATSTAARQAPAEPSIAATEPPMAATEPTGAATEPIRTATRPSGPAAPSSGGVYQRPVWSPNRYR